MTRTEEIKATTEAKDKRAELFSKAVRMFPDGHIFWVGDEEYQIITRNVIEAVGTDCRYFRGLDW